MTDHAIALLQYMASRGTSYENLHSITCPVCFENKSLCVFPCRHGVCTTCLLHIFVSKVPKEVSQDEVLRQGQTFAQISCPICRATVFLQFKVGSANGDQSFQWVQNLVCDECQQQAPWGYQCILADPVNLCFKCMAKGCMCCKDHVHSICLGVNFDERAFSHWIRMQSRPVVLI